LGGIGASFALAVPRGGWAATAVASPCIGIAFLSCAMAAFRTLDADPLAVVFGTTRIRRGAGIAAIVRSSLTGAAVTRVATAVE
jgi:hypothetical protein